MNYVYGGSFNPPTKAHLKIIEKLINLPDCEHVIIIPVGDDYKKPYLVDFSKRAEMLEIVTKQYDQVIISDIEDKHNFHGTLKTLNLLSHDYSDLCFVMGTDQLKHFKTWIEYKKLLASYPFLIIQRNQMLNKEDIEFEFRDLDHHFRFIPFDEPISSTNARTNEFDRRKILDQRIIAYIEDHDLYKE